MDRVDDLCESDIDMSVHDLPEMSFRDAYVKGLRPEAFLQHFVLPAPIADTTPSPRFVTESVAPLPEGLFLAP
jgi:hypothetical protein